MCVEDYIPLSNLTNRVWSHTTDNSPHIMYRLHIDRRGIVDRYGRFRSTASLEHGIAIRYGIRICWAQWIGVGSFT